MRSVGYINFISMCRYVQLTNPKAKPTTSYFVLSVCLSVRPSVMDVGVAVTDLRVVCKIITCVSAFTFTEWPY